LLSYLFQETPVKTINGLILFCFAYQSVLVAFVSYLAWFFLVHSYPVSRLASFSFLTPVFATLAGVILLGEPLTMRLIVSLILVSIGIYIVNRQ
jgi:drug/metabolite transporter (DMT)-like permease